MISRLPALLAQWAGALIAAAASLIPLITRRLSMSTPTPVPLPPVITGRSILALLAADIVQPVAAALGTYHAAASTSTTVAQLAGARIAAIGALVGQAPWVLSEVMDQTAELLVRELQKVAAPSAMPPPSPASAPSP